MTKKFIVIIIFFRGITRTLGNRNGLNGGLISFNEVSEIPDPMTVLIGEIMVLMGVLRNVVKGVIIIGGAVRFNGVKFYR